MCMCSTKVIILFYKKVFDLQPLHQAVTFFHMCPWTLHKIFSKNTSANFEATASLSKKIRLVIYRKKPLCQESETNCLSPTKLVVGPCFTLFLEHSVISKFVLHACTKNSKNMDFERSCPIFTS